MNTFAVFKTTYPLDFESNLPGREIAEDLVRALRDKGFRAEDPKEFDPFYDVTCKSGEIEYHLMVGLYYSDQGAWVVHCPRKYGFLKRIFGATEENEIGRLLDAIHGFLRENNAVSELRWFREKIPSDPFKTKTFAVGPRVYA